MSNFLAAKINVKAVQNVKSNVQKGSPLYHFLSFLYTIYIFTDQCSTFWIRMYFECFKNSQ